MRKEFRNTAGEIESCDEIVKSIWGPILIRQGFLWGVVDEDHREILPCIYEDVVVFPHGRMGAKQKDKWGLFDAKGIQIIPCEYDDINEEFYGDYFCVELGGKMGLVYKDGTMALPCKYENIGFWPGEYIVVCLGGKWGIVNEEGGEVVPCIYDSVEVEEHAEEGYAKFELDGRICRRYDNGEVYWD